MRSILGYNGFWNRSFLRRWIGSGVVLGMALAGLCDGWTMNLKDHFEAANRHFEQGHFEEAARSYEALITEKQVAPEIFYNLGNTYQRLGNPGKALVNYQRALMLSPRDPEIRQNRDYVFKSANPGTSVDSQWNLRQWVGWLSVREWQVATLFFWWSLWLGFSAMILFPRARNWIRKALWLVLPGLVFFGAGYMLFMRCYVQYPLGFVGAPEAVVRFGPLEESESYFQLNNGAVVSIEDRKDEWVQVRDGNRRKGWIKLGQLLIP